MTTRLEGEKQGRDEGELSLYASRMLYPRGVVKVDEIRGCQRRRERRSIESERYTVKESQIS